MSMLVIIKVKNLVFTMWSNRSPIMVDYSLDLSRVLSKKFLMPCMHAQYMTLNYNAIRDLNP